jgi:hypothetical protein
MLTNGVSKGHPMRDGRSQRRASVVQFISALDKNIQTNLNLLVESAKQLNMEGFESVVWEDYTWHITAGRLLKGTGRNAPTLKLHFHYPPKICETLIERDYAEIIKALFVLRFHRKNQCSSNQRNFITAAAYVCYQLSKLEFKIHQLVPEHLEHSCKMISSHYTETTAYNLHKHVAEFAAHCDANKLCKARLDYKYSKLKRPNSVGGLSHKRLDDPIILETRSDKLVTPELYKLIGELFQNVPKEHKYRFYILILTLLACTGRRFSEITLLPCHSVQYDSNNHAYIEYFPRKTSHGDVFTPKRKLYLPTQTLDIVAAVINELNQACTSARLTAAEMQLCNGPDIRFLDQIAEVKKLYKQDLEVLGIPGALLHGKGWIREHGYAVPDKSKLNVHGKKPRHPIYYTSKKAIIEYCQRDYSKHYIELIHIDQNGKKYYLKDLLIVKYLGLSSGFYSRWIATQCTHSMMDTFLQYLPLLAKEYSSESYTNDFNSHNFRHTMNTLLDEGGLSDLLQTEWFGRVNPRDTKAYQHTSREKRALMLREDLKQGKVGGKIAEQLQKIPIVVHDAYLAARVKAVHDVGAGICVHDFAQTPCERHLQCSADCKDYVWAKDDKGRIDDLKRQYALTKVARDTAEEKSQQPKAKKSIDWLKHNDKKLNILTKQLADNGVLEFNAHEYLQEVGDGNKV